MILIISEEADKLTEWVIDWLLYYQQPFICLNQLNAIKDISLTSKGYRISTTSEVKFSNQDITSAWIRRPKVTLKTAELPNANIHDLQSQIKEYLSEEWSALTKEFLSMIPILHKGITNIHSISRYDTYRIAEKVGLMYPQYNLTNSSELLDCTKSYVAKPIEDVTSFKSGTNQHSFYIEDVSTPFQEKFFPTSIQEKVKKHLDIKCIYLKGKLYSIAILSNSSIADFRIDYENVIYEPWQLPKDIESKTILLMQQLNLDYGVVDFVIDNNNTYYFLEVNPYGQCTALSNSCNYYIEKEIADILCL